MRFVEYNSFFCYNVGKMLNIHSAVTLVNRPMVLIPLEEYEALLAEAGERPTPRLDRSIAQARARFKAGKSLPWKALKSEI